MFAGMIIGATLVIAALMLVGLRKSALGGERHFVGVAVVGLAVAGIVIAVLLHLDSGETTSDGMFLNSDVSLQDAARAASSLRSLEPAQTVNAPRTVASVPSLIDGLQRRLESEPDNASGWALLAQSYAFVGKMEPAEAALQHAVALGLDEQNLRQRVDDARRDPHADLPIESVR